MKVECSIEYDRLPQIHDPQFPSLWHTHAPDQLDGHPNIVCLTEMFNPDYTTDEQPFTENTPEEELLEQFIFQEYPSEVQAVGFCIHRYGARFGNWPSLWTILEEMQDLYVISLRRQNLLRRYFSFQLRTNQ